MGAPLRFVVNGEVSGQGVRRGCTSYFAFCQATMCLPYDYFVKYEVIFFSAMFCLPIGRWPCCYVSPFHLGEPCAEPLRLNVAASSTQLSRTSGISARVHHGMGNSFLVLTSGQAPPRSLVCQHRLPVLSFCNVPKGAVIAARILKCTCSPPFGDGSNFEM